MKQITLGDPKDAAASMASSVAFINLGQWSGLLKPFRKGGSGVHVDLHDGTGQSLLLERGKVRRTDQFDADAAQAICHLADLIQSPFLAKKLVAPGYDRMFDAAFGGNWADGVGSLHSCGTTLSQCAKRGQADGADQHVATIDLRGGR